MGFNLNEYKRKVESLEIENYPSKFNAFYEYLYRHFYNGTMDAEFDNNNFIKLTEDDLLQSLKDYIDNDRVKSQSAGNTYGTMLIIFFDTLRKEYEIINPIFQNRDRINTFREKTREITSELKSPENRGEITEEDYNELQKIISDNINRFDEKVLLEYVNKRFRGELLQAHRYNTFVSTIASLIILKFGIQNTPADRKSVV